MDPSEHRQLIGAARRLAGCMKPARLRVCSGPLSLEIAPHDGAINERSCRASRGSARHECEPRPVVWSGGILIVLAFLVLYPLTTLLLGALTNANPVVEGIHARDLSLTNFIAVLGGRLRTPKASSDSNEAIFGPSE